MSLNLLKSVHPRVQFNLSHLFLICVLLNLSNLCFICAPAGSVQSVSSVSHLCPLESVQSVSHLCICRCRSICLNLCQICTSVGAAQSVNLSQSVSICHSISICQNYVKQLSVSNLQHSSLPLKTKNDEGAATSCAQLLTTT